MSANKYEPVVLDSGLYIGGVPEEKAEECAQRGTGVVLLSARPEHYGALEAVLIKNPDIPIFATAASLRSVKQILNREINERVIKNGMTVDGCEFKIIPDISWIDSVEVYRDGKLILREKTEYDADEGGSIPPTAYIMYSSRYGFTKALAETAADELSDMYNIILKNTEEMNDKDIRELNRAQILLVGTNTINRNAPQSVWRAVTSIDQIRKRSMKYLVFGSYGWAGDGIKLIHQTLRAMGMKSVCNPVEVLFKPTESDLDALRKAVSKFRES